MTAEWCRKPRCACRICRFVAFMQATTGVPLIGKVK